MERRGLKVNVEKTKLMVTGKKAENIICGKFPCGVCGRGVGVNSALCVLCNRWCHARCVGIRRVTNRIELNCPKCVQRKNRMEEWKMKNK